VTMAELPPEALHRLIEVAGPDADDAPSVIEIRQLGGALDREPEVPNSVPTRGVPFELFTASFGGPDEEGQLDSALDHVIEVLRPWSGPRRMPNFLTPTEATAPDELRVAYGPDRYDRLARIKQAYDPLDLFRMNHNIVPAG
jgi:hypothetical protein